MTVMAVMTGIVMVRLITRVCWEASMWPGTKHRGRGNGPQ